MRLARPFAALCLFAIIAAAAPAHAIEIAPDPALHTPAQRTLTVGSGKSQTVWRVFEASKDHYKTTGRIVWMVSPLANPIPKGSRAEERWYRNQVLGLLKALGEPAPKKISISTEFARSSVVADMTPFRANLYVLLPDGREIVDVIYVETITKGAGRLVVMQLPKEDRPPLEAASDFAKTWGKKLKNLTAADWK